MKFIASTVALALASQALASDSATCATKHPSIANAIGKFCQNQSIMVPSTYAKDGEIGLTKHAEIWIKGNCSPAQWVPQQYCFSQFYNMCANYGAFGTVETRKYGESKSPSALC